MYTPQLEMTMYNPNDVIDMAPEQASNAYSELRQWLAFRENEMVATHAYPGGRGAAPVRFGVLTDRTRPEKQNEDMRQLVRARLALMMLSILSGRYDRWIDDASARVCSSDKDEQRWLTRAATARREVVEASR